MRRIIFLAVVVVLLTGARRRAIEVTPAVPELRPERSFAVTDQAILAGFTLDRVLAGIIAHSVVPSMSAEQFFRQIFDTLNPSPGLDASMPHCDDSKLNGKAMHNGYERRCPTGEGVVAVQPFVPERFVPVAIVNRFDMADPGGATCGQYRIVFSKDNPWHVLNFIFEGALRNPRPDLGIAACRPIAQFWANLSTVDSLAERRARLEAFFYEGIEGFPPLLHPDHFRDAPNGIRNTHWFQGIRPPRFYQFRIVSECTGGKCRMFAKPDLLENFVSATLLNVNDTSERAVRYREFLLTQIGNLAARDVNRFFMKTPDEFLLIENDVDDGRVHFPMLAGFNYGASTGAARLYRTILEQAIRDGGSEATFNQFFERVNVLTCEGCHSVQQPRALGDGVMFPPASADFQHVNRKVVEAGDGGEGTRFSISPAMREVFIPNRMRILLEFLKSGKAPERSN